VLAVAGVLLGGLVDESDRVARSELEARHALADINRDLEVRVAEQVDELERVSRLRRFLSPQVADAVVSSGSESFLEPHRREIAVFFCDLRGFTAFAGRVEPEEVLAVLNDYYEAIGTQLQKFEATVGSFAGDGIMAYLNDPNPCERPATRVIEMALGLKDPMDDLCEEWERHGYELGYGIGIAFGHATLGIIGFDGRNDYTPLGTVVNLAARLCDEASNRQCLIDRHTNAAVGDAFETQRFADLALKGFSSPVATYEVLGLR
jgi:adenylate cyclase